MPINHIEDLFKLYKQNKNEIWKDYFDFLRFKTIAAEAEYRSECLACSSWLANYLKDAGFEVEIIQTSESPLILANWQKAGKDKPTVMFYGHYDVQPVDPLELWQTPPFEPILKDGSVYCRGAQDNKGQIFYTISALKALLRESSSLPINVKLCIEGDEEHGSTGLSDSLPKIQDKLKSDYLVIVDVGIDAIEEPSVTLGVRGLVTLTVELTGSNTDLHSGLYGGMAYNPNRALVELLNRLRDSTGAILVPGFYHKVKMPCEEELKLLKLDARKEETEKTFGMKVSGGEGNFPINYWKYLRPTLEINGLAGGYAGPGFKTVIPAKAIAKISARLVPDQDPEEIGKLIESFLRREVSETMQIEITIHPGMGKAFRTNPNSKVVASARKAIEAVNQLPCACILDGASIPISVALAKASGAETVLLGYGLPTDKIHAPNEHFGIERFKKGFATIASFVSIIQE